MPSRRAPAATGSTRSTRPKSSTLTHDGCVSFDAACASRSKRRWNSSVPAKTACSTLIATGRLVSTCSPW